MGVDVELGLVEIVGISKKSHSLDHKGLETCPSIGGLCSAVQRTGLGSLCLNERCVVPILCVGVLMRSLGW